jgi:hypothetical protein
MAHSKVRWISTPAFLAYVGGAHGRGEGTNILEGARTAEVGARTAEGGGGGPCLGGAYAPWRQPYTPLSQPYVTLR